MSGKRVAGTLPTNVLASFADYNHRYRPYEAMSEGSVGAMLKRVEEVLQYVGRVFEHNRVLFVSADYGILTSKHRSYLVELAEEKRLHQTPIDDIVSKSPILSLLYALKERWLDRATIPLRKVEIFQSEILAAIQPCSHRGFSVVMDEPPEAFDSDRKFLAATSFQELTSSIDHDASEAGPSGVPSGAYCHKMIYKNAERRVEVIDTSVRPSNHDDISRAGVWLSGAALDDWVNLISGPFIPLGQGTYLKDERLLL